MTTQEALIKWTAELIRGNAQKHYPQHAKLIEQCYSQATEDDEIDWEDFETQLTEENIEANTLIYPLVLDQFNELDIDKTEAFGVDYRSNPLMSCLYFKRKFDALIAKCNKKENAKYISSTRELVDDLFTNHFHLVELDDAFDYLGLEILFLSVTTMDRSCFEALLLNAIDKYPHKHFLYRWLSDLYFHQGQYEKAFNKALHFVTKIEEDIVNDSYQGDCINLETHTQGIEQMMRCQYQLSNYDEALHLGEMIRNNLPNLSFAREVKPEPDYLTYIDVFVMLLNVYRKKGNTEQFNSVMTELKNNGFKYKGEYLLDNSGLKFNILPIT